MIFKKFDTILDFCVSSCAEVKTLRPTGEEKKKKKSLGRPPTLWCQFILTAIAESVITPDLWGGVYPRKSPPSGSGCAIPLFSL